MISLENAQAIAAAGVLWQPAAGDRFTIDEPELRGQLFWISDLTIEVHTYHDRTILGFNGTTEWALDSVPIDVALWLPREDQLRELLGNRLTSLTRQGGRWQVVTEEAGERRVATAADVEDAYAAALLAVIDAAA